jgi:acetyl esterase/lipase
MKKTLIILLLYPFILIGQKPDYADEFAYEIHRNLDYAGNGNIRQALDIYIPHNRISDELPLVVYIHGGGFQRGSKNYAGRGMPYLRTGRYIFASINYRLSNEANVLEMIYDCKAAIRYLKSNAKKYGIDKNKIGVWGTSAGGHLSAMIGLTSTSKKLEGDVGNYEKENGSVTCAINAFGPSNFLTQFQNNESLGPLQKSPRFKSFFNSDMEIVEITSPINHADSTCIPFFIYHGRNDKSVLIDESENLYSKLKGSGAKEIYFQRITDGPHSVRHDRITQQMLNFFDKYLHNDKTVIVDDSEFSLKNIITKNQYFRD